MDDTLITETIFMAWHIIYFKTKHLCIEILKYKFLTCWSCSDAHGPVWFKYSGLDWCCKMLELDWCDKSPWCDGCWVKKPWPEGWDKNPWPHGCWDKNPWPEGCWDKNPWPVGCWDKNPWPSGWDASRLGHVNCCCPCSLSIVWDSDSDLSFWKVIKYSCMIWESSFPRVQSLKHLN